jgi:hypothetical protein
VTNEYASRYQGLSHQELYNALQAGDPDQIDGQTAGWRTVESTTRQLADDLSKDLEKLDPDWGGPAGEEYQRRLGLVSDFALRLSDDQSMVKRGLETLSSHLKTAKSKAESPEATNDNDKTISGAAQGAAAGGVVGGVPGAVAGAVIGGVYGHDQDEKEKEAAKSRMVQLVSTLAADYVTNAQAELQTPTVEPPDLPGGDTGSSSRASGVSVTAPRVASLTGRGSNPALGSDSPPRTTGLTGNGGDGGLSTIGSEDSGRLAAAGTTAAAAAGVIVARNVPLAGGLASAGMPAGMPAGGVLASGSLSGTSAVAGGGSAGPGGIRASATSLTSSSSTHGGLQSGAAQESAAGRGTAAGRGSVAAGRGGVIGGGPNAGDDEAEEYTSWLTEDEMDWGGNESLPPAVLGGQPGTV